MNKKLSSEEIDVLSIQLSRPVGEKGLEIAANMDRTNEAMIAEAVAFAEIKPGNKILEIGHGSSRHVKGVLADHQAIKYHGVEISETMHELALSLHQAAIESGDAQFHLTDGKTLPFADGYFDRIFTINTVYFWSEPKAYMAEITRTLKPEGIFAMAFGERDFMKDLPFTKANFTLYSQQDVAALISSAGLQITAAKKIEDTVLNNAGETVNRQFSVIAAKKVIVENNAGAE